MSLFNFKSLVRKYMTGRVKVVSKKGFYDKENFGKWREEVRETDLNLFAIVPLSRDDLKFDDGGTYDHNSRKLYCYNRFNTNDEVINTLEDGTKRHYKILSVLDYSDFDEGLMIYFLGRADNVD